MEDMTRDSESSSLPGHEILRWIEDGFREYGPDPWLMIRELAQNSRDAGASVIHIRTGLDSLGREFLAFEDNGSGMSLKTARKHLFRFYSSSKEGLRGAAGRFGIGFWSVWRFHPVILRIQSKHRKHAWSLKVDPHFTVTEEPAPDLKRGTRITLIREPRFTDPDGFSREVQKSARKYCSWLQRIRPFHGPLPVYVNEESISLPLKPPGTPAVKFRGSGLRGAAALGERPEVRLFSGGLPVWKGTSLEELGNGNRRSKSRPISGNGLYPVVWMDITDLPVDLSRRHALHDPRLAAYRRRGERALSGLFNQVLDSTGSRGWRNRIRDWMEAAALRLQKRIWLQVAIILALLIPAEIFLLNSLRRETKPAAEQSLNIDSFQYDGAGVGAGNRVFPVPDLSYRPRNPHYFRLFTASEYHLAKGFLPSRRAPEQTSQTGHGQLLLSVRIQASGGAILGLPHPAIGEIDPLSIRWNGKPPVARVRKRDGGYRFLPPAGPGELTYHCVSVSQESALSLRESRFYTHLPVDTALPQPILKALDLPGNASIHSKAEAVKSIVRNYVVPDSGSRTAQEFKHSQGKDWVGRVLHVGRGDCDVINGFAVLLLRRMGIPSRLGVGWIGEKGRLVPSLHAWAEFHHGSWKIMDLSGRLGSSEDSPAPLQSPARRKTPIFLLFITIAFSALILFHLIRNKHHHEGRKGGLHSPTQRGKDLMLSRMALGAMLFPRQWGMKNRLWTSGMLPLLNGRKLSLLQALKRGRYGGIFFARSGNPLARHGRHRVLDRDRSHFLQIYRLIHGIIDLDHIQALELKPFGTNLSEPMIRHLSILGRKMGKMGFTVARPAPDKKTAPTWMDLTNLNISTPRFWQRPVLIISLSHGEYLALAREYPRYPEKSLFQLVRDAVSRAPIMTRSAEEILAVFSRNLMGGGQ